MSHSDAAPRSDEEALTAQQPWPLGLDLSALAGEGDGVHGRLTLDHLEALRDSFRRASHRRLVAKGQHGDGGADGSAISSGPAVPKGKKYNNLNSIIKVSTLLFLNSGRQRGWLG
jgi:hypothetical protein